MLTLSQLARKANSFLTRGERESEHTGEKVVVRTENAPEWVKDLCLSAHGEFGPDDWRYEFIKDSLNVLEEDEEREEPDDIDTLYPYTHDRLKWLASHLERPGYCDEFASDFGWDGNGGIVSLIAGGMYSELEEVFRRVKDFLESRVELLNSEPVELLQHLLSGLDLSKYEGHAEQAIADAEGGEWLGVLSLADRVRDEGNEELASELEQVAKAAGEE